MRKVLVSAFFLLISILTFSQKNPVAEITRLITRQEVEAHLTFLASDEMRGRNTGSPELEIAANYIAAQFKLMGLKPVPSLISYFQTVPLENVYPATNGKLTLADESFGYKEHFVILEGGNQTWSGEVVYVGYGSADELKAANVKDKMVIALAGSKDSEGNPMAIFNASNEKFKNVKEAGAAGLVEIFASPQIPWAALVNYFANNTSMRVKGADGVSIPHLWLKGGESIALSKIKEQSLSGSLAIEGIKQVDIPSRNVLGVLEGSDPKLKNEYLVVSAHYDHVGVQKNAKVGTDSIFNGARDNAIGVVGMSSQ